MKESSQPTRRTILLHQGWKFQLGDLPDARSTTLDDSGWREVTVPHDWAIEGPFDPAHDAEEIAILEDGMEKAVVHTGRSAGLPVSGTAWYRCKLPHWDCKDGERMLLVFDGAMSHSEVYVNGKAAGGWPYGYTSFYLDVTDHLQPGEKNLLAVRLNPPELTSRWYPGAGLFRKVRTLIVPACHFAMWGTRITTSIEEDGNAVVSIFSSIQTGSGKTKQDLVLAVEVLDDKGKVVASSEAPMEWDEGRLQVPIQSPRLWNLKAPVLYTARLRLRSGEKILDQISEIFGIRKIEFHPRNGFFLNGERVQLRGVCQHHDLGPLGAAFFASAAERQISILQDMGANAIRTSHNPADPELLSLCDRMGMLVIEEAFDEWAAKKMKNGYHKIFHEWAEKDLRAMIRRDANHPCIILWSIGNEVPEQKLPDGGKVAKMLADICRDEDPSRLVTAGFNSPDGAIENGLAAAVDVVGWNYATKGERDSRYADFLERFPDWIQYGSETSSAVSSLGTYHFPVEKQRDARSAKHPSLQISSYDLSALGWGSLPDEEFAALEDAPAILGEFVWTGFDYLGEPTPFYAEWPSRSSYFGMVDLCGTPKDRFYLYRSHWNKEADTLHILPHWNWKGKEGEEIPVFVYSNHHSVELFLNGHSLGEKTKDPDSVLDRFRFRWSGVSYQPGVLRAVARDENGKEVQSAEMRTAGTPHHVQLSCDSSSLSPDPLAPVFVVASIVDAEGILCPDADNRVFFAVQGDAKRLVVGNGDATSTEIFQKDDYPAFHGICVLVLAANSSQGKAGGVIEVSAHTEDGLKGKLSLPVLDS